MDTELQVRNFGLEVTIKIISNVKLFSYVTITPGLGTGSVCKNVENGALSTSFGIVIELFQNPDFVHFELSRKL
jgi:hypothetical protein